MRRSAKRHGPSGVMATGRTSFKGMRFDQLHRLQIFLGDGDIIQLTDNRGWQQELTGSNTAVMKKLVEIIRERDPDVIEGHDIFRATLEELTARAKTARVPLKLGRDSSVLRARRSRVQIACHVERKVPDGWMAFVRVIRRGYTRLPPSHPNANPGSGLGFDFARASPCSPLPTWSTTQATKWRS